MTKRLLWIATVVGTALLAMGCPQSNTTIIIKPSGERKGATATAEPRPQETKVPATATPRPTSTPVPPTATPTPRPTNTPVPPTATATPKPKPQPKPSMDPEARKREARNALKRLRRMAVSSEETLKLSGGDKKTTTAKGILESSLADRNFTVATTTDTLVFSPSDEQQDRFRKANDCNLAFLVKAESKKKDQFGKFYLFEAEVKGKVLNLTTHELIASKTVRKKSKRKLDEAEAATDALEAAAKELAKDLIDEVVAKWQVTSLVRYRLVVTNLALAREVDSVRNGLGRRPGIYYVSLERWDEGSGKATYEVLCRCDVEEKLTAYVGKLGIGEIRVQSVDRHGKVIKAEQDIWE